MNQVLEIHDLHVLRGGKSVLQGINLELTAGQICVLLGANGAGKTTLMWSLLGKIPIRSGTICSLGEDCLQSRAGRRRWLENVGFVPDRSDAPTWMTLEEFWRYLAPRYRRWNSNVAQELVARFAIPSQRPLAQLSLGQTTIAMLATALAGRPRLLLLDEPFSNLDPLAREEVATALVGSETLADCATLISTHDLELASRLADRVAWLEAGRINRVAGPTDLAGATRPLSAEIRRAYSAERCVSV